MSPWGWIAAGLTAGAAIVFGSGGKAKGADVVKKPEYIPPKGESPKQHLYAMLRAIPELTEDQRLFIVFVAHGETGATYKPTAHNDTTSEVNASRKAWANSPSLAERLRMYSGLGVDAWAIGSGGYGGRLFPYFGDDMLDAWPGAAVTPVMLFQPLPSLASSLITAHKLQQLPGWKNSDHTAGALRIGYYGIAYMDDPLPPERRSKYLRHLRDSGIGEPFLGHVIPEFPPPRVVAAMIDRLRLQGF